MQKSLLAAVVAAGLFAPALSCAAFAAPQDAPQQAESGWGHGLSDEDRAAFTDARIAGLKAGLKLTPAQEKNWPAVETAIREQAKARAARAAEWRKNSQDHEGHHNLIEAVQERAKALQARAAELTALADAAKPLYDSLDDSQKHRLGVLLHAFHKSHRGGGGWGHGDRD